MKNLQKKYIIKIPSNTKIFYSEKKKIILIEGPLKKNILKLKVKINVINKLRAIEICPELFSKKSRVHKKKIKILMGTTTALIKQLIIEVLYKIYKKLNLNGVGFRTFDIEGLENKLFMLKLGWSHPIYLKPPMSVQMLNLKFTKLFIYGNSYQNIAQTASKIRSCKPPEPYKGKGIKYGEEKIILKEGKKV